MIVGGDEFGRTQKGNNNAYCQDNDISWFNWEHADWQQQLIAFTSRLIVERKAHPVFRRPKYFQGRRVPRAGVKDLMWFDTDGSEMNNEDWQSANRCLAMLLSGDALDVRNPEGEPVRDDTFLFCFNAYHEPVNFALPGKESVSWEIFLNTHEESGFPATPVAHNSGDELAVDGRTLVVLRLVKGTQDEARNVAWKRAQKQEPVAPPEPRRPSRHEPIDPTTAGPRFRARTVTPPKTSELTQGTQEPKEPPLK